MATGRTIRGGTSRATPGNTGDSSWSTQALGPGLPPAMALGEPANLPDPISLTASEITVTGSHEDQTGFWAQSRCVRCRGAARRAPAIHGILPQGLRPRLLQRKNRPW